MGIVFGLVLAVAVLMAMNRIRYDVLALLVILALILTGILPVGLAIAGFGSSVVILVASLLIVGEMLDRTGVARAVGSFILSRGGKSETKLLILTMISAALLGSVMSSTAVVAVFIPIVAKIAAETGVRRERLLMPVSYAALISGMLTLIATTPNIVVSEELQVSGSPGFGFFDFTLVGLAVLAVGIVYILTIGRKLLPTHEDADGDGRRVRTTAELLEEFRGETETDSFRLLADSRVVGKPIKEARLSEIAGADFIGLRRRDQYIPAPRSDTVLQEGDILLINGEKEAIESLRVNVGGKREPVSPQELQRWLWQGGGATILVHPDSSLIGRSLRESRLRTDHGVHALGLRQGKQAVEDFQDAKLQAGDMLLVVGAWERIDRLRDRAHDFIVVEVPRERTERVEAHRKMPIALAILAVMVLLSLFNLVPLTAAVLIAALAAILTRCLSMEDAYRAIHWPSIVLIAGLLPLADALAVTGGTDYVVNIMLQTFGDLGPRVVLTAVFFLTAAIGLFLSNTASAVLVAPIAIFAAERIGVSPYPMAIAVVFAASAAFVTPVSSPVVTLVVEPGRYRFLDFVKVGLPMLILTWLVVLILAPMIFPFSTS